MAFRFFKLLALAVVFSLPLRGEGPAATERGLFELTRSPCLEVDFVQRSFFGSSVETYEGTLIKRGNLVRVVYRTEPPFRVVYDGRTVELGYAGERPQRFKPEDYPNPVLTVLLNLDRLERVFFAEGCVREGAVLRCSLRPGDEGVEPYLKRVEVTLERGRPLEVLAEGEEYGRVEFKVLRWNDRCPSEGF
ncbi:MAG: hypothetical protein GXO08_03495 [Aquificae bacterium]|nr:hypothetical protein [Aquificota bacterium]